jgi:hypothetical protein
MERAVAARDVGVDHEAGIVFELTPARLPPDRQCAQMREAIGESGPAIDAAQNFR